MPWIDMKYNCFRKWHAGIMNYSGHIANREDFPLLLERLGVSPDEIIELQADGVQAKPEEYL